MASIALVDSILSHFKTAFAVVLSRTWVSTILSSMQQARLAAAQNNITPLCATIKFRLEASDISVSLSPSAGSCFPADVASKHQINVSAFVQVVDITDMGSSRIDTLDRIEMVERGEQRKGKEIVRIVPEGDGTGDAGTPAATVVVNEAKSIGPHRLLLEDASGERCYGIEFKRIDKVELAMSMGTKLSIKGAKVLRGVMLLEPGNTTVLGGKIDEWQKTYIETRKDKLKAEIQALRDDRT